MVLAWNERGSSIKAAKLIAVTTKEGTGVDMCFINRGGLKTFLPSRINRFSESFLSGILVPFLNLPGPHFVDPFPGQVVYFQCTLMSIYAAYI